MDKLRLILICLHVLITILMVYNLHPHLSPTANTVDHNQRISTLIGFINDLFRISLYHSASIIAIRCCRRYGAGMIRATGILFIGELLQVITIVVQNICETQYIGIGEHILAVINILVLIVAIVMTFLFAKKTAKYQRDLMRTELLTTTACEAAMGGGVEFSLV